MKNIVQLAVTGFFIVIALAIVFVKAGKGGGQSGGQQTATIITSGGAALGNVAASLEGP